MRVAALCSGYGGLELGLQQAGVDVELAWFSEIDQHAAAVMEAHHRGVPNLGDLTKIVDAPRVDIVTAGFPCQPVSHAGKRKGVHDDRWLIDDVCRIGREVGADWLVLENVAGIYTANGGDALARVVSGLAENGFAAEWTCVRASDVGAPHQRLRWFCVAHAADADNRRRQQRNGSVGAVRFAGEDGDAAADPDGGGHGSEQNARGMGGVDREDAGRSRQRERSRKKPEHRGAAAADARRVSTQVPAERRQSGKQIAGSDGEARRTDWGSYADAIHRWEPVVGRYAPEPTDDRQRLNPRFVEWMMGLPDGWVTDVVDKRGPALKMLGNGVVPQQAAYAIHVLAAQYGDTVVT